MTSIFQTKLFLRNEESEITISKYQKLFDVSRNTAIRDLNHLIDENYVFKSKKGKNNIYKIINRI